MLELNFCVFVNDIATTTPVCKPISTNYKFAEMLDKIKTNMTQKLVIGLAFHNEFNKFITNTLVFKS